ncbi:hypothetical protein CG709_06670 [Lachnotalea glycerini]|nr:hypothetical protein CG709_06670 [Lachnotalea glycerini]
MNVFIADDEAIIREGLKYIVDWKELGFSLCGEANNGDDTLAGILTLKPDLVLLDIRMPKLEGTEIVRISRERNYKGHFIILSGFSDFKYAQTAIRYGVDYYLTKPIDEDELTNAITSVKETIKAEQIHTDSIRQFKEKAKHTVLRDILLNSSDFESLNLKELNILDTKYQVIIYENYNRDSFGQNYSFAELLKISNKENHFFEHLKIHEKDIIVLKGSYALERFLDVLRHYRNIPQKGSYLDSIFLAYGRIVTRADDIHYSYEDALNLMNRRFFCEQNRHAIGYQKLPDVKQKDEINPQDAKFYSNKLCNYIQSYNRNMIVDTLVTLEKTLYLTQTDVPNIKLFLTDIYLQIKQEIDLSLIHF